MLKLLSIHLNKSEPIKQKKMNRKQGRLQPGCEELRIVTAIKTKIK